MIDLTVYSKRANVLNRFEPGWIPARILRSNTNRSFMNEPVETVADASASVNFPSKVSNITGRKFGLLTVENFSHIKNKNAWWNCLCECGNRVKLRGNSLKIGNTKSCGCATNRLKSEGHTTHGHNTKISPEYRSWNKMKDRCGNPKSTCFKDYGGRGITFCERWTNFVWFLEDMGSRPDGTTLERIDNDKPYCKENCRWATRKDQQHNKRNTVFVTYMGTQYGLHELTEKFGFPPGVLYKRIHRMGWTVEQAVNTPVKSNGRGQQISKPQQIDLKG